MLDWWTDLPWWLRLGSALLLMAVGVLAFWFVSVRLGAGLAGLGLILFALGGKSESEKKGYRF